MKFLDKYKESIPFFRQELAELVEATESWFYDTISQPENERVPVTPLQALSFRPVQKLMLKLRTKSMRSAQTGKPVRVMLEAEEMLLLLLVVKPYKDQHVLLAAIGKIDQKSHNFRQFVRIPKDAEQIIELQPNPEVVRMLPDFARNR